MNNLYSILNTNCLASQQDITKAYHKQALKVHPDKHDEYKIKWTALFQQLQDAYQILKDPNKRKRYDIKRVHNLRQEEVRKARKNQSKSKGVFIETEEEEKQAEDIHSSETDLETRPFGQPKTVPTTFEPQNLPPNFVKTLLVEKRPKTREQAILDKQRNYEKLQRYKQRKKLKKEMYRQKYRNPNKNKKRKIGKSKYIKL